MNEKEKELSQAVQVVSEYLRNRELHTAEVFLQWITGESCVNSFENQMFHKAYAELKSIILPFYGYDSEGEETK